MPSPDHPELHGSRISLRIPRPSDAAAVLAYYQRNADFFRRFDPPYPEGFYTLAWHQQRIEKANKDVAEDREYRFVLFKPEQPDHIIGNANLSAIQRGPFQACNLGYGLDEQAQGQGMMTEALRLLIDHAFTHLKLHRIQANHLPDNLRSAGVLQRLGFVREGYAPAYLYINGAWRDHVLNALSNPHGPEMG